MKEKKSATQTRLSCAACFIAVLVFIGATPQHSPGDILIYETIIHSSASAIADGVGPDDPLVRDSEVNSYASPPSPTGRSFQSTHLPGRA